MDVAYLTRHGCRLLCEITTTLAQLHAQGITWAAVSPENVIISKDDKIWLLNFGRGGSASDTIAEDEEGLRKMGYWLEERLEACGLSGGLLFSSSQVA